MGFKAVNQCLNEMFPQVDPRILRAVAIEHPKDADAAAEIIILDILPLIKTNPVEPKPQNLLIDQPGKGNISMFQFQKKRFGKEVDNEVDNDFNSQGESSGTSKEGAFDSLKVPDLIEIRNDDSRFFYGINDAPEKNGFNLPVNFPIYELPPPSMECYDEASSRALERDMKLLRFGYERESSLAVENGENNGYIDDALVGKEENNKYIYETLVGNNQEDDFKGMFNHNNRMYLLEEAFEASENYKEHEDAENEYAKDEEDDINGKLISNELIPLLEETDEEAKGYKKSEDPESEIPHNVCKVDNKDGFNEILNNPILFHGETIEDSESHKKSIDNKSTEGVRDVEEDLNGTDKDAENYDKSIDAESETSHITDIVKEEEDYFKSTVILNDPIPILEETVEDAKNYKKLLFASMESVLNMMREAEEKEEAAQAEEEATQYTSPLAYKVEDIKQLIEKAKQANNIHAGQVYGEKSILATEARELQNRLIALSAERDRALSTLDEMRRRLEERIVAAENAHSAANLKNLEKESIYKSALEEQEALMELVTKDSKMLQRQSEENSKLREFLVERGRIVDTLQGEISVICEDVRILKEKFDQKLPLSESVSSSQTTCRLASSHLSIDPEKLIDSDKDDDWELFDKSDI